VARWTGSYRLSKRTTAQVMDERCGVPMSVGAISQSEQATREVVTAPVEKARAYVHEQRVAHLDETSWRQGAKRAWLWGAVTSCVTVLLVRMSRGGQVARELLGETCSGILVPERYSASNGYPVRWCQVGWAQLLRDFEAIRGRGGVAIGRALQPFPRSKRSRHVSAHSAFQLDLSTREGRMRRCRRRGAPASKGRHLPSSLGPLTSFLTSLP
jgi:hypothetical protein